MSWAVGILILAAVVALILKNITTKQKGDEFEPRFRTVKSLQTPAEQRFLMALDSALDENLRVFSMVRVADVIKPSTSLNKTDKRIHFAKTSQKHFDFVVCDSATLKPTCVIELNDKSHERKDRKKRDEFLVEACASANLPLKFFRVAKSYDQVEIASFVNGPIPSVG